MIQSTRFRLLSGQAGLALPIALIMLVAMILAALALFRSVDTATMVAGNLTYTFNPHLTVGGGINSLPGVRTTEGTFPYWLGVDSRHIADEYFRPSYTTGLWARGAS